MLLLRAVSINERGNSPWEIQDKPLVNPEILQVVAPASG
jgi:hypothetical protein